MFSQVIYAVAFLTAEPQSFVVAGFGCSLHVCDEASVSPRQLGQININEPV
jgi:hypothetical protein